MKIDWKKYKKDRYTKLLIEIQAKAKERDIFVVTLHESDRDLYDKLVIEAENFKVSIPKPGCWIQDLDKTIIFTISISKESLETS